MNEIQSDIAELQIGLTNNCALVHNIPNPPPKESNQHWCSDIKGYVKLCQLEEKDGGSKRTPVTVHTFIADAVKKYAKENALAYKKDPQAADFTYITYEKYYQLICTVAKAFIKLGLTTGAGVCILGFNSVEWFISHVAGIFAGGISCGVYATNSPEACSYVLQHCKCEIMLVDTREQLDKILKIRAQLPTLKHIIQWLPSTEDPPLKGSTVIKWDDLVKMGEGESDNALIEKLKAQVPNQCCTLIYTSGTTGQPKGVMLSHDNVTWTAVTAYIGCGLSPKTKIVSYLPLSHIAGLMSEAYSTRHIGCCTYFAQPDALKGTLKKTLIEVQPEIFGGVPRVFEKIQDKMVEIEASMGAMKRWISGWAKNVGTTTHANVLEGKPKPFAWGLANHLVFSKVRANLGFTNAVNIIAGAAPLRRETMEYFQSYDITIYEAYGTSESSSTHTYNNARSNCPFSVGKPEPGSKIRLDDVDSEGQGEVCLYGRNIFMGYLNDPEKTKEALTKDGWYRSGDLGKINEKGFLFITGRIKELIITAGGENIAPVPIEDAIKKELPCISNAMVVGDKRKFLAVLLAFKTIFNMDTNEPTEKLAPETMAWCSSVGGQDFETITQLRAGNSAPHAKIHNAINAAISRVNEASISRATRVQKYIILPRDFSIPGGEYGPTLKVRRPIVCQIYEKEIDELYAMPEEN